MFGMDATQTQKAAEICEVLGRDWRELLAGSEGFLTGEKRAGLLRHKVVWGEMDSMVSLDGRRGGSLKDNSADHSLATCQQCHICAVRRDCESELGI
jgi:hypothetical protein